MEPKIFTVFAQYDSEGRLLRIENEITETEEGWELVDEGEASPRYTHAQNNYLDGPLADEQGIYLYKRGEDGKPVSRGEEELQADEAALPGPEPDPTTLRIAALEEELLVSYLAQAELYEKTLVQESETLIAMLAVAELYEMMLGGN